MPVEQMAAIMQIGKGIRIYNYKQTIEYLGKFFTKLPRAAKVQSCLSLFHASSPSLVLSALRAADNLPTRKRIMRKLRRRCATVAASTSKQPHSYS